MKAFGRGLWGELEDRLVEGLIFLGGVLYLLWGNGWHLKLPGFWQWFRFAIFVVSGLFVWHAFRSAVSVAQEIDGEEVASREKPSYSPIVWEHGRPIQAEPTHLYRLARAKLYGIAVLITFLAGTASYFSWSRTPRGAASNAPNAERSNKPLPPKAAPPTPVVTQLVKQDGFTTLIPFAVSSFGGTPSDARIPIDYNEHDPLLKTYTELAGIGYIQLLPQPNPTPPPATIYPTVTDDEAVAFVGHVLQCYFLRSIDEMQQRPPITYTNYESGKGITTTADNPISVPDAQLYANDKLNKLWTAVRIQFTGVGGPNDWIWKHHPLNVPKNTLVQFVDSGKYAYSVRFERKPDLRLDFDIRLTSMDRGIDTFPHGFETFPRGWPPVERFTSASTYVFYVEMNFQWSGNRQTGHEYEEWAQGLFSGLKNKLVLPPQN